MKVSFPTATKPSTKPWTAVCAGQVVRHYFNGRPFNSNARAGEGMYLKTANGNAVTIFDAREVDQQIMNEESRTYEVLDVELVVK